MKTKSLALVWLLVWVSAVGVARSQQPDSELQPVYVACTLGDSVGSVLYVNSTFRGFASKRMDYEQGYRTMLRENYPGVYGSPTCVVYPNELQADHQTAARVERVGGMYRHIVTTSWVE